MSAGSEEVFWDEESGGIVDSKGDVIEVRISDLEGNSLEVLGDVLSGLGRVLRDYQYYEAEVMLGSEELSLRAQERTLILRSVKEQIDSGQVSVTTISAATTGSLVLTALLTSGTLFLLASTLSKLNEIVGDPVGESVKRTATYEKWVEKLRRIWDIEVVPKRKAKVAQYLEVERLNGALDIAVKERRPGTSFSTSIRDVSRNGSVTLDLTLESHAEASDAEAQGETQPDHDEISAAIEAAIQEARRMSEEEASGSVSASAP